ncbi:MAG: hypothetical protein JO202_01305, partial [Ktedonobacteraceae bacterium]|nr:hypothetical protein [Ktedonobacteraceae bacterium]
EGGHYGPFAVQQDGEWAGWPEAGQVMRYFRKQAKLSAKAFGVLYGRAVNADGSPICERWILEMELENKVPMDMSKRKAIARLLGIPPMLLGLAVLEHLAVEQPPQWAPAALARGHTALPKVGLDTTKYQDTIRTLSLLHVTSHAQSSLSQLHADIGDLERLERQAQGEFRSHVQELLFVDQFLTALIVRDQREFSLSYYHANEAVRVAKSMNDPDLIVTALRIRGRTRLEWGLFGTMEHGVFQMQHDQLRAAIRDFAEASQVFPDGKNGMHPQSLGPILTSLSRAQAALAVSKGRSVPASVLLALDDVADTVDRQSIDDLYTRMLVIGRRSNWHQGEYLTTRATAFMTAGLPGQALREFNAFESLAEKTYGRDETRQFVWLDILKANAFMGLGEFRTATRYTRRALLACQDINSVTNMAIITDIYGRLLTSSHKASGEVQELGEMLKESSQATQ